MLIGKRGEIAVRNFGADLGEVLEDEEATASGDKCEERDEK